LVPEGNYYITVEAKGYYGYKGEIFTVEESKGVFMNVEMKGKFGWKTLVGILFRIL
jgi:hypothetical protein